MKRKCVKGKNLWNNFVAKGKRWSNFTIPCIDEVPVCINSCDMGQALQLRCEYDASILQSLTYLLIWLIFLRWVKGNSLRSYIKPYLSCEMGRWQVNTSPFKALPIS